MLIENEKIFYGEEKLKYILERSTKKSDYLLIIFSAFSASGKPAEYNYYNTVAKFDCNKLFILDDQNGDGCYYLGHQRDFSVERSVIKLIDYICDEVGVKRQNIMTCGSSKGGYASLYFSIKYNFGHAVVCAPQSLLGDFLSISKTKTLNYIAGDKPDSRDYLNRLLFDVVDKTDRFPEIVIHVGEGDYHYKDHALPLIKAIEKRGGKATLTIGDFTSHNEVSFYQRLLKQKIKEHIKDYQIKNDWPDITGFQCTMKSGVDGNHIESSVEATGNNLMFAWYIFKDEQRIHSEWYKENPTFKFTVDEPGKYRIQSFTKNKYGNIDVETSDYFYVQ